MPDRFEFIDKPQIIVCHCPICQEEIQKGDEEQCELCGVMTCDYCQRECWVCKRKGCKWCMTDKDTNEEYICDDCEFERNKLMELVINSVHIPSYSLSGKSVTDEETILEYSSAEYPGIEVRIKKVRT